MNSVPFEDILTSDIFTLLINEELFCFATLRRKVFMLFFCIPTIKGISFLIIPAFSFAIDSKLSPKISLWSKEIGVIAVTFGETTLVESSLPPKPTSITAKSTFFLAKYVNAKAVVVSKKVEDI